MKTLDRKILEWLFTGETGVSSKAIASVMVGIPVDNNWDTTPGDPSDFKRCLKLINQIPEIRPRLHEMDKVSKRWKRLVNRWDEVESCFMSEVSGWLEGKDTGKSAIKTYDLMHNVMMD